jgi:hypothetical protein
MMSRGILRTSQIAALAIITVAHLSLFPARARADGDSKACGLLTSAEVEAALGAKVSNFTVGAGGFCYASAPTVTVMVRVAKKSAASGREAKGIEMAKQMGARVDVQKFGATTCSTLVPPANLVQAMGFNTTCSIDKGDSVAAVEVTAKSQANMVSIEKLRPLAEKMTARF